MLFVRVLAEVVRRRQDAHAIVVGEGPMKGKMLKLAHQLGIAQRIDWRGAAPATTGMPEMDIMVHTSFYEGQPYSLLEACVDLLPTVATNNFGSEAVFRPRLPGNIGCSPDAKDLASIVLSISESEVLRLKQLSVLEEIAREFSAESMISKIEAEYCALVRR